MSRTQKIRDTSAHKYIRKSSKKIENNDRSRTTIVDLEQMLIKISSQLEQYQTKWHKQINLKNSHYSK